MSIKVLSVSLGVMCLITGLNIDKQRNQDVGPVNLKPILRKLYDKQRNPQILESP